MWEVNSGLMKSAFFPLSGWVADERVFDRSEGGEPLAIPFGEPVGAGALAEGRLTVVHRHQGVDELPERLGESLVGRLGVGEHGVPTPLGHGDGVEHGGHRGLLHEGDVGVPPVEAGLAQVVGERCRPPELGVVDPCRAGWPWLPRDVGCASVICRAGGEGQVLLGGEVLAGKEDHLVLDEGGVDRRYRLGIERTAQVHPVDLGTGRPGEGPGPEPFGGGYDGRHAPPSVRSDE